MCAMIVSSQMKVCEMVGNIRMLFGLDMSDTSCEMVTIEMVTFIILLFKFVSLYNYT